MLPYGDTAWKACRGTLPRLTAGRTVFAQTGTGGWGPWKEVGPPSGKRRALWDRTGGQWGGGGVPSVPSARNQRPHPKMPPPPDL
ncbi:hypothetical protein RC1_1587 [Rhodospirillum centenum SW]|uniref:Uncharacterized protein n=1 Tax=Rhodospirillum centenum (strain ATCC 51521 / SW) TaxID=414684 RepID=B6IN93_RHOCS|nr:hypothetical protein RC1_1587 [Rhodospirillum centenum SW]